MPTTTVEYAVPVDVAFDYLAEPRNRPQWQSSLRRVELLDDGEPRVGLRWRDHTAPGIVPTMEITTLDPGRVWAETGTWHAITADLELRFESTPEGCRVRARFEVRGTGLLRPVGWAASGAGVLAIGSDLRRAARILAERAH